MRLRLLSTLHQSGDSLLAIIFEMFTKMTGKKIDKSACWQSQKTKSESLAVLYYIGEQIMVYVFSTYAIVKTLDLHILSLFDINVSKDKLFKKSFVI